MVAHVSERNNTIKQADTILLTYPLNWNMSRDIMRNDLEYYERLTSERTPAMTWSFFTVGWKWVDDESKMTAYFLKSYQDYVIQPFKVCMFIFQTSHTNYEIIVIKVND